MRKIFVSYTTRDPEVNRALLYQLDEALSQTRDVYIDLIHNDSEEKQKRVLDELRGADSVVFLNSDSILKSRWAMHERDRALELGHDIYEVTIPKGSPPREIIELVILALNNHGKQGANKAVEATAYSRVPELDVRRIRSKVKSRGRAKK